MTCRHASDLESNYLRSPWYNIGELNSNHLLNVGDDQHSKIRIIIPSVLTFDSLLGPMAGHPRNSELGVQLLHQVSASIAAASRH